MENVLTKKIAQNLRRIRIQKGLSQEQVAEMSNMHWTYYSRIERALHKDISVRRLKNITDAFGVTLDDVVYG
ncbi:MAG: helix-turn-helix domain-containing protein [Candidatus Margulisbacteria bacterium]|jgi:transcriptional regulator with XRE-family HTH domain|nr:helix-turn-helix domain-containing protein [Candidatus Margulisiibacteriota bacterium]